MQKLDESSIYQSLKLQRTVDFMLSPPESCMVPTTVIMEALRGGVTSQVRAVLESGKIGFFMQTPEQVKNLEVAIPPCFPVWLVPAPGIGLKAVVNITRYGNKALSVQGDMLGGWINVAKMLLTLRNSATILTSYESFVRLARPYVALMMQATLKSFAAIRDYPDVYTRCLAAHALWFLKLFHGTCDMRIGIQWASKAVNLVLPKTQSVSVDATHAVTAIFSAVHPNDHNFKTYYAGIGKLLDISAMSNTPSSDANTFPSVLCFDWLSLCGEASVLAIDNLPYFVVMLGAVFNNLMHYNDRAIKANRLVSGDAPAILEIFS